MGVSMPKAVRTEVIEGKEFRVVALPPDVRLQPARAKKRTLWNSLSSVEKKAFLEAKRREAQKKRKRQRRRKK